MWSRCDEIDLHMNFVDILKIENIDRFGIFKGREIARDRIVDVSTNVNILLHTYTQRFEFVCVCFFLCYLLFVRLCSYLRSIDSIWDTWRHAVHGDKPVCACDMMNARCLCLFPKSCIGACARHISFIYDVIVIRIFLKVSSIFVNSLGVPCRWFCCRFAGSWYALHSMFIPIPCDAGWIKVSTGSTTIQISVTKWERERQKTALLFRCC